MVEQISELISGPEKCEEETYNPEDPVYHSLLNYNCGFLSGIFETTLLKFKKNF